MLTGRVSIHHSTPQKAGRDFCSPLLWADRGSGWFQVEGRRLWMGKAVLKREAARVRLPDPVERMPSKEVLEALKDRVPVVSGSVGQL